MSCYKTRMLGLLGLAAVAIVGWRYPKIGTVGLVMTVAMILAISHGHLTRW